MNNTLKNWISPSEVPNLTMTSCHIWLLDLRINDLKNIAVTHCGVLSTQEQERSDRFLQAKDKQQFIIIRAILRQLLSAYTELPIKNLEICFNNQGKPYLKNVNTSAALYFNISHAGDLALLAFSRTAEVGIDIEYTDRPANYQKLAQRFFSSLENIELANVNDDQYATHFFRLWTRKEAFVKAVGTGLGFPLNAFTISADPDIAPSIIDIDTSIYPGPSCLKDIQAPLHYLSSVACLVDKLDYELYNWPLKSK